MDCWGIVIFLIGLAGAFLARKSKNWQLFFVFVAGIGGGIVIGAVWAMVIVTSILG